MFIEILVPLLLIFLVSFFLFLLSLKLIKGKRKTLKKIISIILILGIITIVTMFSLWKIIRSRSFQFFTPTITSAETTEKIVALTFDDGPTEAYTDEILNILNEKNVSATFFLVGESIKENFELTKKIVQDGHEIGNHTYTHRRMIFINYEDVASEIENTDNLIKKAGYKGEIYIRSPYCSKFLIFPYYLMKNERKNLIWDIEPESYPDISQDSEKIVKHVIENVKPGSIILLHVMNESNNNSRKALPEIIDGLNDKGYEFVTVTELLNQQVN